MEKTDKEIFEELRALRDQLPEDTTIEDLIYKAKKEELQMEPRKGLQKGLQKGRKQVGALIDETLWQRLRAKAILENRNAGLLLDDAIRMYLDKHGFNREK